MESILARALEYTLKYCLKSFSREQFKLQGRTVQLSNLDINGDALHASVGLPPALNVATAKVGKLEIMLLSASNVQTEPIFVQIDRLDLVLKENSDYQKPPENLARNITPSSASSKGSGYGFADKLIYYLKLMGVPVPKVEQHGKFFLPYPYISGCRAPPMASVTIRNLLLYTTNEIWEVVNLKEAREFSSNTKYIYVFKRTVSNSPLGLEFQLHITEALCRALRFRALLHFMTGLCVCLNRGDVNLKAQLFESSLNLNHDSDLLKLLGTLVSVVVDHIFICIKDSGYIEFFLRYSDIILHDRVYITLISSSIQIPEASLSEGENDSSLTRITIAGLCLRCVLSYLLQVGIQGMQIMKPQRPKEIHLSKSNGAKKVISTATGICLQLGLVSREDNVEVEMANWEVENLTFTVKQPIEVVLTSDEAQHLPFLCKSEVDFMGMQEVKALTRFSLLSIAEMIVSIIEDFVHHRS
ncbi:hypothetical protein S83_042494 [Arachis hypogaea]